MRKIIEADLVAKTIVAIDTSAVNALKITFSDETSIELVAEQAVYTSAGYIPGIFIEE